MRKTWIAVLASSFLAACGGGGGEDTAQEPSVVIAAANQDLVARTAVSAVTTMSGAGDGIDLSTGASAAGAARAFAARIGQRSVAGRKGALAAADRGGPLAIPSETVNCTVSGTATLSFNDADNDGSPSVGDRMTMAFDECRESATEMVDGSMAVTLSEIDVDNGLLSFSGATVIDELVVTEGARSARLDGAMTLAYEELSTTRARLRLTVRGSGLSASTTIAGTTDSITFDPDFSYEETATLNASGVLLSTSSVVDGSFSASVIGGRVQLETPAAILQNAADDYPYSGSLRVLGQNSALRLTALDAETVHVQLDANGDGSYETNKNVDWSVLLPD